jgi:hypothetical protein
MRVTPRLDPLNLELRRMRRELSGRSRALSGVHVQRNYRMRALRTRIRRLGEKSRAVSEIMRSLKWRSNGLIGGLGASNRTKP